MADTMEILLYTILVAASRLELLIMQAEIINAIPLFRMKCGRLFRGQGIIHLVKDFEIRHPLVLSH